MVVHVSIQTPNYTVSLKALVVQKLQHFLFIEIGSVANHQTFIFANRSRLCLVPLVLLNIFNCVSLFRLTNQHLRDQVLGLSADVRWHLVLSN